jgi:hypothetical protein
VTVKVEGKVAKEKLKSKKMMGQKRKQKRTKENNK